VGVPLIRRRVSEVSESVMARAHEVAAELMHPGLDEAALLRFAAMVADRAARCAVTIQRAPE
jgi:serine/threonine-protein kinase HipA